MEEQCQTPRCIDCDQYALWSRTIRGYTIGSDDCLHHHKIVRWDDEACEEAEGEGWLERAETRESPYRSPNVDSDCSLMARRKGLTAPQWAIGFFEEKDND